LNSICRQYLQSTLGDNLPNLTPSYKHTMNSIPFLEKTYSDSYQPFLFLYVHSHAGQVGYVCVHKIRDICLESCRRKKLNEVSVMQICKSASLIGHHSLHKNMHQSAQIARKTIFIPFYNNYWPMKVSLYQFKCFFFISLFRIFSKCEHLLLWHLFLLCNKTDV
jgi:hypothetical protein